MCIEKPTPIPNHQGVSTLELDSISMNEYWNGSLRVLHLPFGKALPFVKADGVALQSIILASFNSSPKFIQMFNTKQSFKLICIVVDKVCK